MSRIHAKKKRKLASAVEVSQIEESSSSDEAQPIFEDELSKRTSHWNLEQDYERRPRKQKKAQENPRLPIKTAEGRIQQVNALPQQDKGSRSSSEELDEETPDTEPSQDDLEPQESTLSPREQILQAKEELAKLAGLINEDPDENIGSLRALARVTSSRNATVTRLGLVTQLSIYKDVIPGYRIRPLSEDDMKARISKDVRKVRNFEQAIVTGFQEYVKELGRISRLKSRDANKDTASLVNVAVSCASNLVTSVPHFNFRTDLLKILMDKLKTNNPGKDFDTCCSALEDLFANDEDGHPSMEAVTMLSKMIKTANYHVQDRVINLFLHLRLLADFTLKGSNKGISKNDDEQREKGKKQKEKREFRTKKERKLARERKTIEKEMKEADAIVSNEQRDRMQAETLKLVFGVYFRILKARTPHLMGPVLEGLAKYAHLINQEFFGDILEALKELILDAETEANSKIDDSTPAEDPPTTRNTTRESLLCVITAFALLQGQDASAAASTLNLSLDFFVSHLYRTLYPICMDASVEHAPTSASSPTTTKVVNHTTPSTLLLRTLTSTLLPSTTRPSPNLLAAFTHHLLSASLHLPEKSAAAVLALSHAVAKKHGRARLAALWNTHERRGDGAFDPFADRVEGCNPFAATVWSGELLRLHYAPRVRDGVRALEAVVAGE